MRLQPVRLPNRFPVGTRYVIESRGGLVRSRYLEFPDGRHVDLPLDSARTTQHRRVRRGNPSQQVHRGAQL